MRDLLDKLKLLEGTDYDSPEWQEKFKKRREAELKAQQDKKQSTPDVPKKDKDNTSTNIAPDKTPPEHKDNAGKIQTVNGPITSSSGNWVNWGEQSDNPGYDLWINDVTNQQIFRKQKIF
jgi:hypothetical protein